jgi:hypothetical protein
VKAANPDAGDFFGTAIALSADGSTLAVGARWEDSGGSPADNSVTDSGATYVYVRAGASWVQQAYIKVAQSGAEFGSDVRLSATGDTLVVTATMANKAYVFQRSGSTWTLQAPLSPPAAGAYFGSDAAISDDGNTVVIGEYGRAGNTGAAHVFTRTGTTWSGPLTLTASNADAGDIFGDELAMSGDGTLLVVGAKWEQSSATSIDGDATDNSLLHAGAAYVFRRNGSAWSPEAYLKASDTTTENWFGSSLAVNRAVSWSRRAEPTCFVVRRTCSTTPPPAGSRRRDFSPRSRMRTTRPCGVSPCRTTGGCSCRVAAARRVERPA